MRFLKVVPSLFFKLAWDDSQYGTFLSYLHFSLSVILTLSIQLYWFIRATSVSLVIMKLMASYITFLWLCFPKQNNITSLECIKCYVNRHKSCVKVNLCWAVEWYMLTEPEKCKTEADSLSFPDCIDLLQAHAVCNFMLWLET